VAELPVLEEDLFSDDAIADPFPLYRRLRDLGPVVHLQTQGFPAVGRFADVRSVLGDASTFVSGQGVLWNDVANELTRGTTLASDPPEHAQLRKLVASRLTPRSLGVLRDEVDRKGRAVVDAALEAGEVDAVPAIAEAMPLSVVPDFLGFPEECRPHLLRWARGGVEAGAPVSARSPQAVEAAVELGQYAGHLVATRGIAEGTLGHDVLDALDAGVIDEQRCTALMLDYFGPSLETTLSAIGNAIALFTDHPDQWDLLRSDPEGLMASAFNEVVRLETPFRAFTRVASRDTEIDGVPVAVGTRIGVLFSSANRDERRWDDPDAFDIARRNSDHVGLGYGEHACAGQGLAKLEFAAVMGELARRVERFEPAGERVLTVSGLVRSYSSLPVRLVPARS
jgi:cytochrome P450